MLACLSLALAASPIPAPARAAELDGMDAFRSGAFAEAYRTWRDASDAGDARASRFLGVMYDTGEGVPQDHRQALEWYRKAAEHGDKVAMFNVAVLYDAGADGVPQDHQEAARWYGQAAEHHDGRAEYNLALMLTSGDGVPRDPARAQRLFADAVRDGIAAASAHLRHLLPRAAMNALPPDTEDAAFGQAQRALLSRKPQEKAAAAALFRRAAAGHGPAASMAQYDLAWCTENGVGTPVDREQAYRLYLQAAAGTSSVGLYQIAEAGALHVRLQMQDPTIAGSAR